ncbi:ABC transporter ATP-binding protein [Pseudofrankia sp. BMG5.36]|uniref:ABC transporter ATP-binding protein n=1 Tax=Pseudofrankia sp. BMG5.36 TaxID=1834512 RepID=UPI0008DAE94F|nr:ABC transporter ATP-binding protein [Pseudofrankia sp. BMG5.36]OHV44547.1 ABC transporter ATP-binding protein [Pseudofrankia sp. BMG5.36]
MTTLIEARSLSAGYGALAVVRDLDLEVRAGEVVVLLGPNGAGKTTTLLTLAGELPALAGEVRWRGAATNAPLHLRARAGLGLVTEERSVFMSLTVDENLRVSGSDPDVSLDLFPELAAMRRTRVGLLSGGQQQMLALGRALGRRPALLLADELSLGLAPLVVERLLEAVRRCADDGVGVLLVEQHIAKALQYADRGYVLARGTVQLRGSSEQLRGRIEDITHSYLTGPAATAGSR